MSEKDYNKIGKLLEFELRVVNKHLPLKRFSLEELLRMELPYVRLQDGTIHVFKKNELEKLKLYLSNDDLGKLQLPIIVILRPDIGEGIGYVEDPVAAKAIARILGMEYAKDSKLILYKPHIALLRRYFDTLFQFAIAVELEEAFEEAASAESIRE